MVATAADTSCNEAGERNTNELARSHVTGYFLLVYPMHQCSLVMATRQLCWPPARGHSVLPL